MKNADEWSGLSELLSNLIAKYADALDIDFMPNPEPSSKDTDKNDKLNQKMEDCIADSGAA